MCRKRVTKHVWTNIFFYSGNLRILLYVIEYCYPGNGFSFWTHKNNIFVTFNYIDMLTVLYPVSYFIYGCFRNWNKPLFAPLTFNSYKSFFKIKILKT